MNGCVYRTKDNECDLWTDGKHKSFCDPDCNDKHPTNADRIRDMTDEELAKYLDGFCISQSWECPKNHKINCYDCWLEWLKQECEE